MAHGYSLRPITKGRRSYRSSDETGGQVEGTSTSTTSNNGTSEGRHKSLTEGDSSTVDPIPATPDTPRAAHYSPRYSHSSVMVTSSAISATTTATINSRNRRAEEDHRRPGETREEIEAARQREEARRSAEVIRIRREQLDQGYKDELVLLRKRIVALRDECEEEVKQLREEWEEAQAFERGEVLVVVEDPRLGPGHGRGGKKKNHGPHRPHPQPQPLQPQPLQRQPTRLMAMPTLSSSSHHGPHHTHTHTYGTYGTPAVLDPGTDEIHFGGTDGDNDSEMDGPCSD